MLYAKSELIPYTAGKMSNTIYMNKYDVNFLAGPNHDIDISMKNSISFKNNPTIALFL